MYDVSRIKAYAYGEKRGWLPIEYRIEYGILTLWRLVLPVAAITPPGRVALLPSRQCARLAKYATAERARSKGRRRIGHEPRGTRRCRAAKSHRRSTRRRSAEAP